VVRVGEGVRPIDVLVQARKSSPYVLNQLVPALTTGWIEGGGSERLGRRSRGAV